MTKLRSPRYPRISLPEAVEKARVIYEKDHLNKVPKEVIAQHLGYGSLHGKSLGVISALAKYGLLAGKASGMRITDRSLAILVNEKGARERAEAIVEAARSPTLFAELFEAYPKGASDQTIKAFLLGRKKFLPTAVDGVIRAFNETRDFVQEESGDHTEFVEPEHEETASEFAKDGLEAISNAPEGELHGTGGAGVQQLNDELPAQQPVKPKILFDMETVTISGKVASANEMRSLIHKLEKLLPLLSNNEDD